MQIDLATASPDAIFSEIAIIGAGAAGITMAQRFVAANRRVVLVESGGLDYEAETADFNHGSNVGEPYYDLEHARLRFFGGTTAIWGGRCAELDPIDFEKRPWVPHSGWPFDYETLKPWYAKARKLLDVDAPAERFNGFEGLDLNDLDVSYWSFDRKFDRFGYEASRALIKDPNLTLLLHATVREIVPSENGREIAKLDVRGPSGKRVDVHAKTYILAAGGIENPRILLASKSVVQDGVGNQNDLVGRFFMEHPHARGGRVVTPDNWKLLKAFKRHKISDVEVAPVLRAADETQRRLGILNGAFTLAARPSEGGSDSALKRIYVHAKHNINPTKSGRSLWKVYRRAGRKFKAMTDPATPWLSIRSGKADLTIVVRAEQAPNPDSRVRLNGGTDILGVPRAELDWRLQQIDIDSVSKLVEALDSDLRSQRTGCAEKASWLQNGATQWNVDPLVSAHAIGGYHHLGTTRMATDAKHGVTDEYGRVHGIANLYVAGSSLFPTGGWANPTLTILALALRSSEKILEENSMRN